MFDGILYLETRVQQCLHFCSLNYCRKNEKISLLPNIDIIHFHMWGKTKATSYGVFNNKGMVALKNEQSIS